jgi:photosystem II stability/assembly factor-like uncharacterized protein
MLVIKASGALCIGWLMLLFAELSGAVPLKHVAAPPIDATVGAGMEAIDASRIFLWQKARIVRTDDGGSHWSLLPLQLGTYDTVQEARFFRTGVGWVRSGNSVFLTASFGDSWQHLESIPLQYPNGMIASVAFSDDGKEGWVAGGEYRFDKEASMDHGARLWRYGFDGRADGIYVLRPALYATYDGGRHWNRQNMPETLGYFVDHIQFLDALSGVISIQGSVLDTVDGGKTWRTAVADEAIFPGRLAKSIFLLDPDHAWVSFNDGLLLYRYGRQGEWRPLRKSVTSDVAEIPPAGLVIDNMSFLSPKLGVSLDPKNGTLFATRDGGRTWRALRNRRVIAYSTLDRSEIQVLGPQGISRIKPDGLPK